MRAEDIISDFRRQGYVVVPGFWSEERCDHLRDAVEAIWSQLGTPALYSRTDLDIEPDVNVTPVGFTLLSLLARTPAPLSFVLDPLLLEVFARGLGEGFELEQVSAVLSDQERPFFFWHSHLGGIDGADHRNQERGPRQRTERMVCTLYCCPLDAAHGTMLVQPRTLEESTTAPYPPGSEPWPSALDLRGPTGTLVILDEATWHAVRPMQVPGRRCFAAFFVRGRGVVAKRRDPAIASAAKEYPELARAYGGFPT